MNELEELAGFARELAAAARAETLPRVRGAAAENKAGEGKYDPVTEADRAAERAIRRRIEAAFPGHGISGEEYGETAGAGRWCWSLDPIDGTRAFVCGLPTWVTLIGLLEDDRPVLGLIDAPRLDELYIGYGRRAVLASGGREEEIAVSGCAELRDARVATTDPDLLGPAGRAAFEGIAREARLVRLGLDGYGYARLAAGTIDLVIEEGLKPHDYNAVIPLIRAAGGRVGDWRGGEDYEGGRIVAAASDALFEAALERLRAA
ncbi:MAG: inositol monophosphatase family protein [Allosphingosinicella sp.]|uniref:inositol monophosphatase family protein n=1 Tax=Allosphingosinicella sp. TaxID=2823234 RepID=UPI003959320F